MIDIQKLQNSWYFDSVDISAGDLLFDQWDRDNNIYIIVSGNLEIRKYTNIMNKQSKLLALLEPKEIFGEAALSNNFPKNVSIQASSDATLLKIDAWEDFEKFLADHPNACFELLKEIIDSSNKRVSKSNIVITATAEISKQIRELKNIDYRSIFWIFNDARLTIPCNRILYIEKHPSVENYYVIRYDTKSKNKLLSEVIESSEFTLKDFEWSDISLEKFNTTEKLEIWWETIGYLIYCRKAADFSTDDLKIISSISPFLAWIIKQKKIMDEHK